MPDDNICTRNKGGNIKNQILEANEINAPRKIVGKTKMDRIKKSTNHRILRIQHTSINEWVERRREWDEHVTRLDAERLIKSQGTIYLL